jgi:glycosyltransferase involved in cell wall biosynthesis
VKGEVQVSAIIPCWRCKDTIIRAVDSIFQQSSRPAEVILVDDASMDGTLEFLKRLQTAYPDGWLKVFASQRNGGPGAARNIGWNNATQPYIAFLDADDSWHQQKTELQLKWMLDHPEIDFSGSFSTRYPKKNLSVPTIKALSSKEIHVNAMLIANRLHTRSVMLKRNIDLRFSENDAKNPYKAAEDFLLWLELLTSGYKGSQIAPPLAYFHNEEFGSGYSGDLWAHEKRELNALSTLKSSKKIGRLSFVLASLWSLLKFLRRVVLVLLRK